MRRNRLAAVALTFAATSTACVTTMAAAPAAQAGAATFYTAPASVPTTPGTLIKSEPFFTGLGVYGKTTRIMYSTRDTNDKPTAVTGAYIEPWAKWAGPGPRPVVSFSVGTIGQGDQCAPSKMLATALNLEVPGSIGLNYETTAMNNLLSKGVAVVVTDYVGLGMNDRVHSYMNRADQAHAVLDAARVASKVPGASVKADSKVATYGYSQGGGASGAAVEAAPTYAPALNVAAAYVGAPPAELNSVLSGVDGSPIAGVIGYIINGAVNEYPGMQKIIDDNLNDNGKAMLATTRGQCTADIVFTFGGKKTAQYTKSGESLAQIVAREPALSEFIDAQRIGRLKPTAAVRVATANADDLVTHSQARQLAVDWCGKGSNVTYAPLSNPSAGTKSILNHLAPYITDQSAAHDWVVDRLAGKPATSNCGSIAGMP